MEGDLTQFHTARVLVIGDVILDRYFTGTSCRMTTAGWVPVLNASNQYDVPGGAANVAMNCASLGCTTTIIGVVGDDVDGRILIRLLENSGSKMRVKIHMSKNDATLVKSKVNCETTRLVNIHADKCLENYSQDDLWTEYVEALGLVDVVIMCDENHGTVKNFGDFINRAREAGVSVFVDPKVRDCSEYRGATLIKPNKDEFKILVDGVEFNSDDDMIKLASEKIYEYDFGAMLVTRDRGGMTLVQRGRPALTLPTTARVVIDDIGAGDTVIATAAVAFAVCSDLHKSIEIANIAAGIAVGKPGTATVTTIELYRAMIAAELISNVVSETLLKLLLQEARSNGEKIVMTNGCFDILHAGHASYLSKCKRRGDVLIVAVNTDESVSRLKGASRPIIPLRYRMAVLASLRWVDYVIPFSEDTPARLIGSLLPDVLIKGSDYRIEDVVGGDIVTKNGGKVETVNSIVKDISTTDIVQSIKGK